MKSSINLSLKLILLLILSLLLINCIYLITLASDSINVTDYIKQYNFPAIIHMYLKPLDELGQSEKEFIDLLQGLPEDKQKDYAKEIYKNKSLTPELLEKIKQEQIAKKPGNTNEKEFIDLLKKLPNESQEFYANEMHSRGFSLELLEKMYVGNAVNSYYVSLNKREWDKARTYCIKETVFDHFVSNVKEAVIDEKKHGSPGPIFLIIINNVTINGNYASIEVKELMGEKKDQKAVWGHESKMIFLLEKLNGNWKLSKIKKDK